MNKRAILAIIGLVLVGGVVGNRLGSPVTNVTIEGSDLISAISEASPAAVSIQERIDGETNIVGSGFIVDASGRVLTNSHVTLNDKAQYLVGLEDGRLLVASSIVHDQLNDIALLEINDESGRIPDDLPAVTLGDSENLALGQEVIAIGKTLQADRNSVSTGVVSAIGASIKVGSGNQTVELEKLIQTDALIHPGNSGGPLLNTSGKVIGMNTATNIQTYGIGFAIPSSELERFMSSQ